MRLINWIRTVSGIGYLHTISNAGGNVPVNESLDTASAAGRLMVNVLASVGQWEVEANVGESLTPARI